MQEEELGADMPSEDTKAASQDVEGGGQSFGTPANGAADIGANEPLESSGRNHWRQSTITKPGLDDRGNVFFAAIEMTRMPMILTDPNQDDNPIVFANKAFLDLTGYEEEEVLGRNCRFLQGANTDRETVAELREAVADGNSVAAEILNYKRDGTPFWNALFIGPVHDSDGELVYQFASQLDVTRRRNTEQAFRQAQKMEAIGQLTAGLAHDFNNLLQVVNGNLELLDGQVESERARRHLDTARAAAERGAKLTRQLLAFARKSRLEPRPIDLSALVTDIVDMVESTVGRTIDLQLNLRRRLARVMVDPDQLEMALLNIVINARDAMPGGGVLTISTGQRRLEPLAAGDLRPGDYVFIEVADEGEGMPPHIVERATEPFFTTKKDGKGTGLGLATASGFMQQSRGQLEIDSDPGVGTKVRLVFPVSTIQEPEVERPAARPHVPATALVDPGEAQHILAVDDAAEVLELAVEILSSAGYRVTQASSADEALQLLRAAPANFDLLFTDLVMPGGMNGIVLADEAKKLAPDLAILLSTGYTEDLVVAGPSRQHRDVLGKPYRRSELLDRVRQALNGNIHDKPRRRASDYGAAEA